MRLALDTNRYTDLCRGNPQVVDMVEAADEVWLPFIVLGELRAGFAVGTQGPRNEAVLRRFLLKPGVDTLYADEQPRIITPLCTGNCENRQRPSRPTKCGLRPWCFSIRSPCTTATLTSTHFPNSARVASARLQER